MTKRNASNLLTLMWLHQIVVCVCDYLFVILYTLAYFYFAVQQAAQYSASGNYEKARSKMVTQQRMMARVSTPHLGDNDAAQANPVFANYLRNAAELDDALLEQQAQEADAPLPPQNNANTDEMRSATRRSARSDGLSKAIYSQKNGKAFHRK
jgi:hypothetical protein